MLVCPRCQRTNPEPAVFCYYDGGVLRAEKAAVLGTFAREFVFPSGRKCRSFDDFVQGCQDEWLNARGLLVQGTFQQFFGGLGRADLAKAATEALAQGDPDIGLATFLGGLPAQRVQIPRLDLFPRRLILGPVRAGEVRDLELRILNIGQGQLQGVIKVSEGKDWFKIGNGLAEISLITAKEQKVYLKIDTTGIPAGHTFAGQLTVISNGGVVEIPLRMELTAHPFIKAPYLGARTPRDLAVLMKNHPKPAVALLESGEIARWFASNGWNYPVAGTPARGVASVQQFFEAMGLSKPPSVHIVPADIRLICKYRNSSRHQVTLATTSRKWVYGSVASDQPWLRVLTPSVYGPQKATIGLEIDSRGLEKSLGEARITVVANAGQSLTARVWAEVQDRPRRQRSPVRLTRPMLVLGLWFLGLRLLLFPLVDGWLLDRAVHSSAQTLGHPMEGPSPLQEIGGWLKLPWVQIFVLGDGTLPADWFDLRRKGTVAVAEFRHYLLHGFLFDFVLLTSWLGPVSGAWVLRKKGQGWRDAGWGLIAGAVAGLVGSATLGCLVLAIDLAPHLLWEFFGLGRLGVGLLLLWLLLVGLCWMLLGVLLGLLGYFVRPIFRTAT